MSHGWASLSPALSCPEVSVLSLAEPVSASVLALVVLGWVAGTLQTHALPSQPRFAPLRVCPALPYVVAKRHGPIVQHPCRYLGWSTHWRLAECDRSQNSPRPVPSTSQRPSCWMARLVNLSKNRLLSRPALALDDQAKAGEP